MDAATAAWYMLCFDKEFAQRRGASFQVFFADIMERAHPGAFDRVRPYGAEGDHKCDGYLRTTGTVFQVYAPDHLKLKTLLRKIMDDFEGALAHWSMRMRGWVLVHCERDGLPARAVKLLNALAARHAPVTLEPWGYVQLRDRTTALGEGALASLFGPALTYRDAEVVGNDVVQPIVLAIARRPPEPTPAIRPVPVEKLAANHLSDHVAELVKLGRLREVVVAETLRGSFDPTLGDQLAASFHQRYEQLRSLGLGPDEIFWELQRFAGGGARRPPAEEAAVLTVLAYFFERCDIFEDVPQEALA